MGDLGSSTDPKMSKATVRVTDRLGQGHSPGIYSGKIATLIGDMRVAREAFSCDSNGQATCEPLHKMEYEVAVPCGSVLQIEVDRQIETTTSNNQQVKHWHLELLKFANGTLSKSHEVDDHQVEVNISWLPEETRFEQTGDHEFISPPQPWRPVEVKMVSGHLTVVYTIGDAISFTEFILALRRILADHPSREDILDGHGLLNLSSTREHPLLTKTSAEQPRRWLHVKLQVMDGNEITSWATLLMRDDDLYVHGFKNPGEVVYELLDENRDNDHMLPNEYNPQRLNWTVEYKSMLDAEGDDQDQVVVQKLMEANLGYRFARDAVRVLSSYPAPPDGAHIHLSAKVALAGLIVIVCESARMNPLLDSIAGGWSDGNGFNGQLMQRYVWNYTKMSKKLLSWKRRNYMDAPHLLPNSQVRSLQLRAIYLVRNIPALDLKARLARRPRGGREAGDTGSSGGPGRQPGEPRDGASSSGGSSRSNTAAGDPAGQPSEGSSQPGKDGDSEGPSQHGEDADDVHGHGRPRVELLAMAMPRDLFVVCMKIVAFDGKRGQIIYRKEKGEQEEEKEQRGEEGMVKLILAGPYRGISAEYGCFAIKIDIAGMPSSGSGDKHHSIKWEWDCDDPMYAAQVDTPQPAKHTINAQDGSNVAEVTYAVMSNAREATVQVKFRLKDGHNAAGIGGEISALIDGFEDKYRSVHFRCAKGTRRYFSRTDDDDDSWFLLELARNVVAVPCGRVLHIQVDLQIETDDGKEVEVKAPLCFDNGICSSKSKTDDGNKVQVEVTWYPEQITSKEADFISGPWDWDWLPEEITSKEADEISTLTEQSGPSEVTTVSEEYETDVVYTIGDELSFLSFIMDLRRVAANHRDHREDILDHHSNSNLRSTREHPLLPRHRVNKQPVRWLHVKLEAVEGNETSSTTLAMRDDNLYVHGFMNQQGVWYELVGDPTGTSAGMLPPVEYNPQPLHWGGTGYGSILRARASIEAVEKLAAAHLGRDFAMRAVRRLSSSIHPDDEVDGLMSARLALAGLIFMVCEPAKMNPVLDSIAGGWSTGTGFTKELITDYVWRYGEMSRRLQLWKRREYAEPHPYSELRAVCLVLNSGRPSPMPARGVVDDVQGRGRQSRGRASGI